MLRFGPHTGPVVVIAMPLFEEANRVRAFAVTLCRLLAKRGVASVLPDLPGQGESFLLTEKVDLAIIRRSFAAVVDRLYEEGQRTYAIAFRSGAIAVADARALGRWYLSPSSGQSVMDELGKVLIAAGRHAEALKLRTIERDEDTDPPLEIAGNLVGTKLLQDLAFDVGAYPLNSLGIPTRIVRLDTDRGQANRHVPGTPLWRRAEPDNDPALAALLADDIADWIATCEG